MTDSKSTSVNMTFKALYNYIVNTYYRSFSGIVGLFLSIGAIILLIIGWTTMTVNQRAIYIVVGLIFTVVNPVMLAWKTFKQLKLSPSYKKPLDYIFTDKGVNVSQGEQHQDISWEDVYRVMLTKSMFAIYTNRMHAFVIPVSELGEDKGKIIMAVVQYTVPYKVRLSKNLKEYQSGKGI